MGRGVDRRSFLSAGAVALTGSALGCSAGADANEPTALTIRDQFPRADAEVFLNSAGGVPLGRFAEAGLERYMDFVRLGPGDGRGEYRARMWSEIRGDFARLINASAEEISLVHSTKAGEQLIMDGLPQLRNGGNIVTNDFHFSGSLHNLVGMQRAGFDVRIVKSDGRDLPLESMTAAIDDKTALVSVTLLSNVNGRIEPIRALSDAVHDAGGHLYADIIQAAGIYPIDVEEMGIDFAACSAYKWLCGVHGTGFLYVREGLGDSVLDHIRFPGNARHNYPPWNPQPEGGEGDFIVNPPVGGRRYEPGHVSYLGYSAVYEGLRFIRETGLAAMLHHSATLARRVCEGLDGDRYDCTSPNPGDTPIVAFRFDRALDLEPRLTENRITISLGSSSMRISPAVFNTESDVDQLIRVLNS